MVGFYDKFAFFALAATDKNCKEYLRPYLAELATTICSDEIEYKSRIERRLSEKGDFMEQKSTDKTEKIDIIDSYYKWCKKTAFGALVIAVISTIAGILVITRLIIISFSGTISPLQVCLFISLTLILLGLAGAAVSLHIFYIRKREKYIEYMKAKEAFSSCEETVEKMENSEEKEKMRTYIIKARMSSFR